MFNKSFEQSTQQPQVVLEEQTDLSPEKFLDPDYIPQGFQERSRITQDILASVQQESDETKTFVEEYIDAPGGGKLIYDSFVSIYGIEDVRVKTIEQLMVTEQRLAVSQAAYLERSCISAAAVCSLAIEGRVSADIGEAVKNNEMIGEADWGVIIDSLSESNSIPESGTESVDAFTSRFKSVLAFLSKYGLKKKVEEYREEYPDTRIGTTGSISELSEKNQAHINQVVERLAAVGSSLPGEVSQNDLRLLSTALDALIDDLRQRGIEISL